MADLYDEFVTPAELTGYGRAELEDLNENQFTLSRWLPNQQINDLRYRLESGPVGLLDVADYRAYNAEPTFGRREGIRAIEGSLPPLGRQMTLNEYDQLILRNAEQEVRDLLLRDAARIANTMGRRMEVARAQAIFDARVDLAENGLSLTVDFDRDPSMEPTPAALWDTAGAEILDELISWCDAYEELNGARPGALLTSERVVRVMLRNPQILGAIRGDDSTARVRRSDLDDLLSDETLPPIYTYSGNATFADANGVRATRRIVADHRVALLPAPGGSSTTEGGQLGATLWGTTIEAQLPDYGVEPGEEAGIVVASFVERKTPVRVDTIGAGIALPVAVDANLSLVADILAPAA